MKAVVYYPSKEENIKELEKRVCDVHIDFIKTKVASTNIPISRKRELVDNMKNTKLD